MGGEEVLLTGSPVYCSLPLPPAYKSPDTKRYGSHLPGSKRIVKQGQ